MAGNVPVSHVSDTAKWVAIYRAMESERPDALFRDPYARRLAGEKGQAIVDALANGRRMAWPMIVRTVVMDEIILQAIARDGVDTVLNLAAGLDTRPYRLTLPAGLRWFEADFPDMVAYKETQLANEKPHCVLERVKVDLRDDSARAELFLKVTKGAKRVLVIAEGLLIYLQPEQVAALARSLHAQPAFQWWLIDLATPRLLKMMERTWGKNMTAGNAPFIFGPAEGTASSARRGMSPCGSTAP